ncbi:MAG: secretin N-terminal domain-containing protein [Terriglobales bacterium]
MSKSLCAVLLLALTCAAPALRAGDKGAPYFRHGQQSMEAKNYDQAYVDFQKAMELSPDNVEYQIATQRAQFAAANEHIRKGEQYKASRNYELAQKEMERAVAIDPSNFVAGQELQAIKDLIHPPPPPPGEAVGAAAAASLQERLARAAGPVELGPVANTVIRDFTVNSDPKNAYLAAGKLAGLNVIFDASSQGGYSNTGRVSLDLHNLTLLDILRVLDVATDSFYTPITSNTILVANNSVQKHQAVDPTVLKVFYVKNVQAPTDLTELAQAIRGLMQPQPHIVPVASVNALVMRDTPDKVAMVQKLLDDLDKAPPEVVVDVRILQVNRDRAQDLGLLPPTSFSIGLQAPASSTSNNSNNNNGSNTNGTGTPTTTTNSPTLNELTHLSSSNFAVTIPNATLNALLNDSNTQTIQEPQLRAIQGQKATLQIGQKIPVATGSFQPGIGGVGINPLVNTQFTQQPVGVNIDMTPQIHGDNSVLLKERIEISNVDGYVNLGGIQQPIIGNRVIDHTIELRNGQSSVLGGMIVNTVTHNVNGIPGLSQIPLFKYLFSSTHDETQHTEIVIVLTPHIVHSLNITPQDERALATGTQDDLQLRELPPATLQPPAPSTANPQPAPPAAGAAPAPAPAGPQLVIAPDRPQAQVGQSCTVNLDLRQAKDAYALTFQLNYDPKLLSVEAMNLGGFLSSDSKVPALVHREDAATGTAQVSLSRPPNASGLSGNGTVLTVTFMPKAAGESPLTISRLGARGPGGAPQPLQAASATVTIQP